MRTYDCAYSDGELATITCTRLGSDGTRGDPIVVWRRRAGSEVRDARRRIERELPDRLLKWVSRNAPADTFAVVLARFPRRRREARSNPRSCTGERCARGGGAFFADREAA
jgi:hypothetical protein